MKTILLPSFGGTELFNYTETPKPVPGPDEVLIQTKSISINPVDVKTRAGKGIAGRIKDQLPVILGWDISGVVTEVGNGVTSFKKGDEVFSMLNFPGLGKVYAEYVVAKVSQLALKPANISHDEAAAATLAALTAWQGLTHKTTIKKGDRVLVHAASGGVGHFAVQLAKQLGAYVIGTSSSANKEFVLSLGADEHFDYKTQPFENVLKEIDFVFDAVGTDYSARSLGVLKKGGTLVSILGGVGGEVAERAKALGISGHNILVDPSGEEMKTIAEFLESGKIKAHVSKTFSFDQMAEAHSYLENGRTVGKITVTF